MKHKILSLLLIFALFLPSCVKETESFTSETKDTDTASGSVDASDAPPLTDEEYEIRGEKYAYLTLSESEQRLYKRIYASLCGGVYAFSLSEDPTFVFECLYADCPELVMLTGEAEYTNGVFSIGTYMTHGEYLKTSAEMEEKAKEYASLIPEGADDFQTLSTLFKNLVLNTSYDREAEDGFDKGKSEPYVMRAVSAVGALLEGKAICEGYARAFLYLIQSLGYVSSTVRGSTATGYHAWLIFGVDGKFYHCDPTWAEGSSGDDIEKINCAYFAMTDEEISLSRTPNTAYALPVCNSMDMNYYVNEGLYFDTFDPEAVVNRLKQAHDSGMGEIYFQFSDTDLVAELYLAAKLGGFEELFGELPFDYIVSTHTSLRLVAFRFI